LLQGDYFDSCDTIDTNQNINNDSWRTKTETISSQISVSDLIGQFNRQHIQEPIVQAANTNLIAKKKKIHDHNNVIPEEDEKEILKSEVTDARWASPDEDSSEPRIIASPLNNIWMNNNELSFNNDIHKSNIQGRNGILMKNNKKPMEQLVVEVDPVRKLYLQ